MSRHTPETWEHRFEHGEHGVFFGKSHSQCIAWPITGRGDGGMEEAEANARLIAAAPKLLEDLRFLHMIAKAEGRS